MRIGYYVLDAQGLPRPEADSLAWGRWFQTADRTVARTQFRGGYVSTVFLGIDLSMMPGPPVLWETMVFGGRLNELQQRYTSREEALSGHEEVVARAKRAQGQEKRIRAKYKRRRLEEKVALVAQVAQEERELFPTAEELFPD